MKTKETRLSVRISPALKKRIVESSGKTGLDEPTIVRQCLEAFCDHVEIHGRITLPLAIGGQIPPSSQKTSRLELSETARK